MNVPPFRRAYATRYQQRMHRNLQRTIDALFVLLSTALDTQQSQEADRIALLLIAEIDKLPQWW